MLRTQHPNQRRTSTPLRIQTSCTPCPTQWTHAKGLWVVHYTILEEGSLNSAFLDGVLQLNLKQVLSVHPLYIPVPTVRPLQPGAPHSSSGMQGLAGMHVQGAPACLYLETTQQASFSTRIGVLLTFSAVRPLGVIVSRPRSRMHCAHPLVRKIGVTKVPLPVLNYL